MKIEIENLEQLRRTKGISYDDLEKQNISRWTYHSSITWKRAVTPKTMKKMVQIFNVNEKDLENLLKNSLLNNKN